MTDWVPEARNVPAELTDEYQHATYPPARTVWASVADRLDSATKDQLLAMAKTVV